MGHLGWQAAIRKQTQQQGKALAMDYSKRAQMRRSKGFGSDAYDHKSVAPHHDLFRTWSVPAFLPSIEERQPQGAADFISQPSFMPASDGTVARPRSTAARCRTGCSASIFTASDAASSLRSEVVAKVVEDEVARAMTAEADIPAKASR